MTVSERRRPEDCKGVAICWLKAVYVRDAWAQDRQFGVIASSDDHMGQPGKPVKGVAAVFSPENTREGICCWPMHSGKVGELIP